MITIGGCQCNSSMGRTLFSAAKMNVVNRDHSYRCRIGTTLSTLSGGKFICARGGQLKSVEDLPGPQQGLSKLAFLRKMAKDFWKLLSLQLVAGDSSKKQMKSVLRAQIRDVEKYGRIFKSEYVGLRPRLTVKVANPADVETLFRTESNHPRREEIDVQVVYKRKTGKPPGLIFANGSDWYKSRRAVSARILRPKEIVDFIPALSEISDEFIQRLRKVRGTHGVENEIPNLEKELFHWSFESVCFVVFGKRFQSFDDDLSPEAQDFISATTDLLDALPHLEVFPSWFYRLFPSKWHKKFAISVDKLYLCTEQFISSNVAELERKGGLSNSEPPKTGMDLLTFLLSSDLSKKEIIASLIDLLFAGVDTTSTAIMWCLYLLGKNPDKQAKLYNEVSTVWKSGEYVTPQLFSKMPYLKATIKETLRSYPLTFLTRVIDKDLVLSNYLIPAGTPVIILLFAMSHDKSQFENPSAFLPERWLKDELFNNAKDPFAFLPFGYGRRMCVGRRIAEAEMYLLLMKIVQNFHIQYVYNEEVERSFHGIVTIPDRPIQIQLCDR